MGPLRFPLQLGLARSMLSSREGAVPGKGKRPEFAVKMKFTEKPIDDIDGDPDYLTAD